MKRLKFIITLVITVAIGFSANAAWATTALETRVAALEVLVTQQQNEIAALKANAAVKMAELGYLQFDETTVRNGVAGPHIIFEGVNLHLQDGSGDPEASSPNGLGNLIIGYNQIRGGTWQDDRGGSHNIVLGSKNDFPGMFNIVHGYWNTARGKYSATIAGDSNDAGSYSAIIGGYHNTIPNSDLESVIIGGGGNSTNTGYYQTVIGGQDNTASGHYSTVTGGRNNAATGNYSSVSGGYQRTATGDDDWAAGSLWEDQ